MDKMITVYSILAYVVVSLILISFNAMVYVSTLHRKYWGIIAANVIETFGFFIVVLIQSNLGIIDIVEDILENRNAFSYCKLFIWMLMFTLVTNIFGFYCGCFARKDRWTKKDSLILMVKNNIKVASVGFLIVISVFAVVFYLMGTKQGNDKTGFKIIIVKDVEEDVVLDEKYKFPMNGQSDIYNMYAVVYETEDSYLVCQIFNNEGKYEIDKTKQMLLPKENIKTFYNDLNELNKMRIDNNDDGSKNEFLANLIVLIILIMVGCIIYNNCEKNSYQKNCGSIIYYDLKNIEELLKEQKDRDNIRYFTNWQSILASCKFLPADVLEYLYQVYDEICNYNVTFSQKIKCKKKLKKERRNSYKRLQGLMYECCDRGEWRYNKTYEKTIKQLESFL